MRGTLTWYVLFSWNVSGFMYLKLNCCPLYIAPLDLKMLKNRQIEKQPSPFSWES